MSAGTASWGRLGPSDSFHAVGIVGAGAWGTALAQLAARTGRRVLLWAREAEVAEAINRDHENPVFLPGIPLDPAIRASDRLVDLWEAEVLLLVAPAQYCRSVCRAMPRSPAPVVICAKGFEQQTGTLLSEVVAAERPDVPLAVLAGPSFAAEVARGLPAAVTLACADQALGYALVRTLGGQAFRPYWHDDVIGAQIGSALKNVLAIASGVVMGRRLGENARAALLTRGLSELMRLGDAMGARRETLMGLSGLGDLMLTATSLASRNTSLGAALGEGRSLDEVLGERRSVAEGVWTAKAMAGLAERYGLDMPIARAVAAILHEGADLDDTIQGLLSRPFKPED
ncbi:MAG: NAD(P)H-dependent glycerol-3-phosphate dehydrogenase [Alphaproteobacteria bacterium]|jgi:glycerol-3-phosphate dehydrogenase (NAD(P)+)|nr:NAD(P)H-dependent glycerol-3-phosphate dehydrogenase [Alphaproteobacteria bacterium]